MIIDPASRFVVRQHGKRWLVIDLMHGDEWRIGNHPERKRAEEQAAYLREDVGKTPRYFVLHDRQERHYVVMDRWADRRGQIVGTGPHWPPMETHETREAAPARCAELNA